MFYLLTLLSGAIEPVRVCVWGGGTLIISLYYLSKSICSQVLLSRHCKKIICWCEYPPSTPHTYKHANANTFRLVVADY